MWYNLLYCNRLQNNNNKKNQILTLFYKFNKFKLV